MNGALSLSLSLSLRLAVLAHTLSHTRLSFSERIIVGSLSLTLFPSLSTPTSLSLVLSLPRTLGFQRADLDGGFLLLSLTHGISLSLPLCLSLSLSLSHSLTLSHTHTNTLGFQRADPGGWLFSGR